MMNNFKQINEHTIQFEVDTSIYNDAIISKALYWLSDLYFIERHSDKNNKQIIVLEQKGKIISDKEYISLKIKINQDFIDFKVRDIVNNETKNIRDILYVKAFANCEDFEDYNLISK